MSFSTFVPHPARIARIAVESDDTRTFTLDLEPPVAALDAARPGQFVMLSVFGYGEAAFTLSDLPLTGATPGTVAVTVRRVGSLTGALFTLPRGARVGVRGPFGRGFPDEPAERTAYVAGGCGLSPLVAAVNRQIATRPAGTEMSVLYGARDPEARIHRGRLAGWGDAGVHVVECVERAADGWSGRVGVVVEFLDEAVARAGARRAAVCGPPAMLRCVADGLCRAGLDPDHVHLALERYMKCGVGRCGHCYVDDRYVCTDGPLFSYAELLRLPDAFAGEMRAAS
jgi:NAD(P)H-flavin reductase